MGGKNTHYCPNSHSPTRQTAYSRKQAAPETRIPNGKSRRPAGAHFAHTDRTTAFCSRRLLREDRRKHGGTQSGAHKRTCIRSQQEVRHEGLQESPRSSPSATALQTRNSLRSAAQNLRSRPANKLRSEALGDLQPSTTSPPAETQPLRVGALKLARAALGEDADGVGDQGEGDDGGSGCKHGTHIQTSKIEWVCGLRPMARSL